MREVLFRTGDLEVRRVAAGDGRRVVITFDSYTDDPGLDRPGFGEGFFPGLGVTAIHVLSRGNDWYQYAGMTHALEVIRGAASGAERRMTYGSSMGGYAAVRFAGRVGAQEVLALQPQYSINPATMAFDDRWPDDARRIRWRAELDGPITGAAQAVVVFDPSGVDAKHHARIDADIGTRPVRVRGAGHSVGTVLGELGLLGPLVEAVLDGVADLPAFEAEVRRRRRESSVWLSELAAAQPAHRPRTARGLAERAVAVLPHPVTRRALADAQARLGEFDAALGIYADLVAAHPGAVVYLAPYSKLMAQAGRPEDAIRIADAAIAADPTRPGLRAWRARLLGQLGRYGPAIDAAKDALAQSGGARPFLALLWRLRWRAAWAWINRSGERPVRRAG